MRRSPNPTHDTLRAKTARALAPGCGYCGRCGMPWSRVNGHVTDYTDTRGCFPLCEDCWTLLGHPEARIPYYRALVDWWDSDHPVDGEMRRAIGQAVAAGR